MTKYQPVVSYKQVLTVIENNPMFWVFVKRNLTSYTAKTVRKDLMVGSASQINITVSAFSCCSVKGLKVHCHGSFPLYSSVSYMSMHSLIFEIHFYIRNKTGCFEKCSFLKAELYCRI